MGKKFSRFKYEMSELIQTKYKEWQGLDDDVVTSFDPTKQEAIPKSSGDVDLDLYRASSTNNIPWVEKLLKFGANGLTPQGEHDLTSLHVCMSAAVAARIVNSLPKKQLLHLETIKDDRGNNPLHACARSNRQDALLCFVECGFDLSWTNDAGRTPAKVAFNYSNIDTCRLCKQLLKGHCWCGTDFDLEEACQMYLKIYSYREVCGDVYAYIMDQKKEDMRDELEIKKKLNPLLESQAERKAWAAEKKEEAKQAQGGTDVKGALAAAMKAMEKFDREMKRREEAEQAGIEYVEPDEDEEEDDMPSSPSPGSPSGGGGGPKKKGQKKESLKSRIKTLQVQLDAVTDPSRWRAYNNSLGFPHDVTAAAASLITPSLALHIRIGCSNRTYVCSWCNQIIKRSHEKTHCKIECKESREICIQCTQPVKKRLMKHHLKYECLARKWVYCPNQCGKEMKSNDLRKHMKLECENRKKKCKWCLNIIVFHEFQHHLHHDCTDCIQSCVVDGCLRTFHKESDSKWRQLHQRAHLQKQVKEWTSGEVGFWLEHSFPFFGDFLMLKYKKKILNSNVNGKILLKQKGAKELRKLLIKVIGMPEDHAYTVSEAIVGKAPVGTSERRDGVEHPKRVRVGAYLSSQVIKQVRDDVRSSPYKMKAMLSLEDF